MDYENGDFDTSGQWRPDWRHDLSRDPRQSLYWLVDMLIAKRRRDPSCPPSSFAARIAATPWKPAFPSLDAWCLLSGPGWHRVPVASSAEAAIQHCGIASPEQGHWHGDLFVAGPESECEDTSRHKPDRSADARAVVNALVNALPKPAPDRQPQASQYVGAADETYFSRSGARVHVPAAPQPSPKNAQEQAQRPAPATNTPKHEPRARQGGDSPSQGKDESQSYDLPF